ncbi:MAG: A/G-specific adenine glycosylase [Ignavibacteria bacterium]|nr:A/G-specific adenine glycosylase [Ignavibacteria bacterium]
MASSLLRWYARHGRRLPWRNTSDPYRILVSEVMLQQTQVHRVLGKYPEFLHRFPTLPSLSRAQQRSVIKTWRGLGYNNRAVRLHRLARTVVAEHRGRMPEDEKSLSALPGLGRYTVNALRCSAFGAQVPLVDVNVRRSLSRLFWHMPTTVDMRPEREIWNLAQSLLPRQRAYAWNQALMDMGARVCTARNPRCAGCPVSQFCRSRRSMKPAVRVIATREPSRDGLPNRIYRGRIIRELSRGSGKTAVPLTTLGKKIHPRYDRRHQRWLLSLLEALQKDGLIGIQGKRRPASSRVFLS